MILRIGRCQSDVLGRKFNIVNAPVKYFFEKTPQIFPCRLAMKFYRTDNTMVSSRHFHPFVTVEVEHTISLSRQLSDSSLGQIVVNRKSPIIKKSKYLFPKMIEVIQCFCKITGSIYFWSSQIFGQ